MKKSAIVSLVALTAATALLPGCGKKPQEAADEAAVVKVAKAQEDVKQAVADVALCRRARVYYPFRDKYMADHKDEVVLGDSLLIPDTQHPTAPVKTEEVPENLRKLMKDPKLAANPQLAARVGNPYPPLATLDKAEKAAETNLSNAVAALDKASSDTALSPSVTASSKMAVGNGECVLADLKLARIEAAQRRIEYLLARIDVLAARVEANNLAVNGLKHQEPVEVGKSLDQAKVGVTKGDNGQWTLPGASPFPAKETVEADIAKLNKTIADMTAEKMGLEDQIKSLNSQSVTLAAQSKEAADRARDLTDPVLRRQPLRDSNDLFEQSAKLHREAEDLRVKVVALGPDLADIDKVNAEIDADIAANKPPSKARPIGGAIAKAQRDLRTLTGQQAALADTLTALDATQTQVTAKWSKYQDRIAEINAASKALIGTPPAAGAATTEPTSAPATAPSDAPEPATILDAIRQIAAITKNEGMTSDENDLVHLRADAMTYLEKADKVDNDGKHTGYFAIAADKNKALRAEMEASLNKPELADSAARPAWQWTVEIHSDADPTLQQALVQQRVARLAADHACLAQNEEARYQVLENLLDEDAKKDEVLQGIVKKLHAAGEFDEARKLTEKAFVDSEACLDKIIPKDPTKKEATATATMLVQAAEVAKVIDQYGRWAFVVAIGLDQRNQQFQALSEKLTTAKTADEKDRLQATLKKIALSADERTALDSARGGLADAKKSAADLASIGVELPIPMPLEIKPPTGLVVAPTASSTGEPTTAPSPTTVPAVPATEPAATPATAPATEPATPPATAPAPTPPATLPATPPATQGTG